jgi:hypothetical protein
MWAAIAIAMSLTTSQVMDSCPKTTPECIFEYVLSQEAQQTAKPSSYSGFLQVLFLSGYIKRPIQMRCEGVSVGNTSHLNNMVVTLCPICQDYPSNYAPLSIIFVRSNIGSSKVPNHILPIIEKKCKPPPIKKARHDLGEQWRHLAQKTCAGLMFDRCKRPVTDTLVQCVKCDCRYHTICVGVKRQFHFTCCAGEPSIPMSALQ